MIFREPTGLAKSERKDVMNPFPLARELFGLAVQTLGHNEGSLEYADPDHARASYRPQRLPKKFAILTETLPGQYFVVSSEDRTDQHYQQGTRSREVLLSTSEHRYDSDEMLQEIRVIEPDISNGQGNILLVEATERLNERAFARINMAGENEINHPHGLRRFYYSIDPQGNRKTTAAKFERLDEGFFGWQGKDKPIRWVRTLDVKKNEDNPSELNYEDAYLIGREEYGGPEQELRVKIKMKQEKESFRSVLIEIGLESGMPGTILFEDKSEDIKVVVHSSNGMSAFKDQEEILRQDPNYAFLFNPPVDKNAVLDLVKFKISLLKEDWNKPNPVFGTLRVEGGSSV